MTDIVEGLLNERKLIWILLIGSLVGCVQLIPAREVSKRVVCHGADGFVMFDSDSVKLNYVQPPTSEFGGGGVLVWRIVYGATEQWDTKRPGWYSFEGGTRLELTADCILTEKVGN